MVHHFSESTEKIGGEFLGNFSEASALVALSRWTGTSNVQIVTVQFTERCAATMG
jgi:hypothetical protein